MTVLFVIRIGMKAVANTAFYQNDFDIDKSIIHRDAASDQAVDKALLWMSRPSGTYCFRERDVFLKGIR